MLKDGTGAVAKRADYLKPDIMEVQLAAKFRGSLIVVYHYLYWACRYPSKDSDLFVRDVLEKSKLERIYLEYPL